MICLRNYGCFIRSHKHCSNRYKCKIKFCDGSCMNKEQEEIKTIYKKRIIKKYKLQDCPKNIINQVYKIEIDLLKKIDICTLKALSNEDIKKAKLKEYIGVIILIHYVELFIYKEKYMYLFNSKEFCKVLIKKYMENVNSDCEEFNEYFKKRIFKNILELCLYKYWIHPTVNILKKDLQFISRKTSNQVYYPFMFRHSLKYKYR